MALYVRTLITNTAGLKLLTRNYLAWKGRRPEKGLLTSSKTAVSAATPQPQLVVP